VAGVRVRSHGADSGRPAVAKTAAVGCLALLVFAVLIFALVGVLNLFGVSGSWLYAISVPLVGVVYWPLVWWTLIWHDLERPRWRLSGWRWRRVRKVPWMVILWGYLMPFVAVFMIVMATVDFGTTWPAAHGGGRPGVLLLQSKSCRKSCTWHGRFRSDDGAVVRESVMMSDHVPADARVGDQLRARDTGNRSFVFAASGSFDWWGSLVMAALAVLYLLGWGACLFIQIRAWRSSPRRG